MKMSYFAMPMIVAKQIVYFGNTGPCEHCEITLSSWMTLYKL